MLALVAGCASGPAEFRGYRACAEKRGTALHDPGEVVGEYLGDDYVRHYLFLPDRLKDDRRQILDITRVSRTCPLVTGTSIDHRTPIGDVWDLTVRRPPQ